MTGRALSHHHTVSVVLASYPEMTVYGCIHSTYVMNLYVYLIMLYSIFSVSIVWELKIEIPLGVFIDGLNQNTWVGGEARSVANPSCPWNAHACRLENLSRTSERADKE